MNRVGGAIMRLLERLCSKGTVMVGTCRKEKTSGAFNMTERHVSRNALQYNREIPRGAGAWNLEGSRVAKGLPIGGGVA